MHFVWTKRQQQFSSVVDKIVTTQLMPNWPRLLDKLFRGYSKSPLPCYSMGIMLPFSTLVFQNCFFANHITFQNFMRISEMKAWWSFFPLSSNWTGLCLVMIKWAFGMTMFPTKWPANEQRGDSHQLVFFAEMKKMETIFWERTKLIDLPPLNATFQRIGPYWGIITHDPLIRAHSWGKGGNDG